MMFGRERLETKTLDQVRAMRAPGLVVGECLHMLRGATQAGMTTLDLDRLAEQFIRDHGGRPSFAEVPGYRHTLCTSVNEEIVHGIPGPRRLAAGDIVSVDVGAILNGYHGDSAWTYGVGQISEEAQRLLRDTEASLWLAIAAARTGNRLGAIGNAVERFATARGYGIVRNYGGHGIGRQMHEEPHVPNHGAPDRGPMLRSGLTLAIEPMLTTGTDDTKELADGWTVVTADGSLAAHFEHTVVIGPEGGTILTERPAAVVH